MGSMAHSPALRATCAAVLVVLGATWARPAAAEEPPALARVELTEPGTALRAVTSYFTGNGWWYGQRIVCEAPCVANVSTGTTFQVVGDGIATSASFELPHDGPVTLHVHKGSAGLYDFGGVLVIGGSLALVVAAVVFIGAASQAHSGDFATGAGLAVGGTVGLAAGLPLMLSNATTVRFE
jgi:hypothetical protein